MLKISHKGLKAQKGIPCWLMSKLRHKGVKRLQKLRLGAVGSEKISGRLFQKYRVDFYFSFSFRIMGIKNPYFQKKEIKNKLRVLEKYHRFLT